MALRRIQLNGEREPIYRTNKITPTLPTDPALPTMPPGTDPEQWAYDLWRTGYTDVNPREPMMQIQSCPPSCPEGYSAITGKLLPGWVQPQCIRAPCPAMFVGDKENLITQVIEMPDGVVVATNDDGDVVAAAAKKPNWLPLALAAGAAYFFLM